MNRNRCSPSPGITVHFQRNTHTYPKSYRAAEANAAKRGDRPKLFDPALKQYPHAFRLGDPTFGDATTQHSWHVARMTVVDHLLRMIAGTVWHDHLVLRGSLLLKAWLGDAARQPGDIDWVFRPSDVAADAPLARQLLGDLVQMVRDRPAAGWTRIVADRVAVDEIWTYERAEGRRIVFPWEAGSGLAGDVQMDIVFREDLVASPIRTPVPSNRNHSVVLWTATKEMSLAWKLLWLVSDDYPQGKDLYDAALLAEQTSISAELLPHVVRTDYGLAAADLAPDFAMTLNVDWDNFRREYPWVCGSAEDWKHRLMLALSPAFDPYTQDDSP
jgi:hypothetical protein